MEGKGWLCLVRSKGEEIVIDGNIIIHVLEIRGNRVRLAINAPKDKRVDRREVHEEIQKGKVAS